MTITTQGHNNPPLINFEEISRKDADSIGISEGEIFRISRPIHYSEGAVDI
jgi:hypothetical protein